MKRRRACHRPQGFPRPGPRLDLPPRPGASHGDDRRAAHSRAAPASVGRPERPGGAARLHPGMRERRARGRGPVQGQGRAEDRADVGEVRRQGQAGEHQRPRRLHDQRGRQRRRHGLRQGRRRCRARRSRPGRDVVELQRQGAGGRQDRAARRPSGGQHRQADGRPVLRSFQRPFPAAGNRSRRPTRSRDARWSRCEWREWRGAAPGRHRHRVPGARSGARAAHPARGGGAERVRPSRSPAQSAPGGYGGAAPAAAARRDAALRLPDTVLDRRRRHGFASLR